MTHATGRIAAVTPTKMINTSISVSNYAALKALPVAELSDGAQAHVAGHTDKNDGGQGLFVYDSSITTFNEGTLLEPDAGSGGWLRLFSGAVDVKWFGAKGDGSTDDTAALVAAAAVSNHVFCPRGRYKFSTKFTRSDSNFLLEGEGPDLTYLDWYGAGTAIESYVAFGGTSLGYIRYRGFSLTDFGTGTTVGFRLGLFTKGCKVQAVKIVGFDYGADIENCFYSSFYDTDFENCGVGLQFTDRCNGFVLDNCRFALGADPSATSRHLQSAGSPTAITYGFFCRNCFFDGMPTNGAVFAKHVVDFVIQGGYGEVYATDSATGLTKAFFNIGEQSINATLSELILIGPADASYTGKWVHISAATSTGHNILRNRQFRASGATFLTTTSGNANIRLQDNSSQAPNGTIVAGTVKTHVVSVQLPATTGDVDLVIPAFKTRSEAPCIRVLFTPSAAVDLTDRFLRVDRIDAGVRTNILNFDFNTVSPDADLVLGETVNCGGLAAMSADVQLLVYINKVGTALVAPACTVAFEFYE